MASTDIKPITIPKTIPSQYTLNAIRIDINDKSKPAKGGVIKPKNNFFSGSNAITPNRNGKIFRVIAIAIIYTNIEIKTVLIGFFLKIVHTTKAAKGKIKVKIYSKKERSISIFNYAPVTDSISSPLY